MQLTRQIFALLLAGVSLLGLAACRRKAPPVTDPDRLAVDFAAAARGAAGAESAIRIVPAAQSRARGLTRVLVSLPDSARLSAVEAVWRSAAAERGVALEPREAGAAVAAFAVRAGGQALLELEVGHLLEQVSARQVVLGVIPEATHHIVRVGACTPIVSQYTILDRALVADGATPEWKPPGCSFHNLLSVDFAAADQPGKLCHRAAGTAP